MLAEETKIYKDCFDMMVFIHKVVKQFPRYEKFGVGQDMERYARAMLKEIQLINQSNCHEIRLLHFDELIGYNEQIKALSKMLIDLRLEQYTSSHQTQIAKYQVAIGRQITGWKKFTEKSHCGNIHSDSVNVNG